MHKAFRLSLGYLPPAKPKNGGDRRKGRLWMITENRPNRVRLLGYTAMGPLMKDKRKELISTFAEYHHRLSEDAAPFSDDSPINR